MSAAVCDWGVDMPLDAQTHEFLALADEHGPAVMGMLRRLCRHEQDAEDAFQETAAKVWRTFAARPQLTNPRGWLMTIAYRVFLDQRERAKSHEAFIDAADKRHGTPPQHAVQSEEASRVQAAIAELTEPLREVVVLHYTGGLTLRETAEAMQISHGTVKSRLGAALNQLRKRLP